MATPPRVDLPKPVALGDLPPPPIPEHVLPPKPSPIAVLGQSPEGAPEIAIIAKRTLRLGDDGIGVPAEAQLPLGQDYVPHPPLPDGSKGSFLSVPEVFGYRSGTDVIIHAHARPERPTQKMQVAVRVGSYTHSAVVLGDRRADRVGGKIVFSDPKTFEAMPLRFELAYGGQDEVLRLERLRTFGRMVPRDEARIAAAFLKDITDRMPGFAYPRNRFGRGYLVADRPGQVEGLTLPNIELPDDLLTPERLIVGDRENWHRQPVPAGFDFLEPTAFPRTAMVGMPPSQFDFDGAAEVKRGQVPRGYCRGNIAATAPIDVESVVNLEFVRNAPIGLRFGFLRGAETIVLSGMRQDRPQWAVRIPDRPPEFSLSYDNRMLKMSGVLHQVFIDVDARRMELIWVGRHPVRRAPSVDQTGALTPKAQIVWPEPRV